MAEQDNHPSLLSESKKLVPGLILTALVAFATSWWNSQMTQNDLRFRIDRIEEKQKDQAAATQAASVTAQQNSVRMAEIGIIQANLAEQLKDLKQQNAGRR